MSARFCHFGGVYTCQVWKSGKSSFSGRAEYDTQTCRHMDRNFSKSFTVTLPKREGQLLTHIDLYQPLPPLALFVSTAASAQTLSGGVNSFLHRMECLCCLLPTMPLMPLSLLMYLAIEDVEHTHPAVGSSFLATPMVNNRCRSKELLPIVMALTNRVRELGPHLL